MSFPSYRVVVYSDTRGDGVSRHVETTYFDKTGAEFEVRESHFLNGELHKLDGPALTTSVIRQDASATVEEYYIHGARLTKEEHLQRTAQN